MAIPRQILELARKRAESRRIRRAVATDTPPPRAIENRYRAELVAFVRELERQISERLIAKLPALVAERDQIADQRTDAWDQQVDQIIQSLTAFGTVQAERLAASLEARATSISNWNKESFAKAMRQVIGVDVFAPSASQSEALRVELGSWARENARLIKSIPQDMLMQVEGIAQRGLRSGRSQRDIAADIRSRFEVTESRAKLIARDQVAKLNGDLTRSRQQAIGIDMYVWRDSDDSRVREDHSVMDGKLCRWDDPTVYSDDGGESWRSRGGIGGVQLHPGEDYQCRCGAQAYLQPLLDAL